MKGKLFLLLIASLHMANAFTQSNSTVKYGNYEIIISTEKKTWNDAQTACKSMGKDWFLASKRQISILAKTLKFETGVQFFWTSDEGYLNTSNHVGKDWSSNSYDAAEIFDVISKKSADFDYKSKQYHYICIHSMGNNIDAIINNQKNTTKVNYLEVIGIPLYNSNFYETQNALSKIGSGWRLPTKQELTLVFNNSSIFGSDNNSLDFPVYWSSEDAMGDTKSAWVKNYSNGSDVMMDKYSKNRAFFVRGNANDALKTSYESYRVGNLEIMKNDFKNPLNNSTEFSYSEAKELITKIGDGWRLPTISELKIIFDNKNLGGNTFYDNRYGMWKNYWSSSNQNNLKFPNSNAEYGYSNYFWIMDFGNGKCFEGTSKYYVRAVR